MALLLLSCGKDNPSMTPVEPPSPPVVDPEKPVSEVRFTGASSSGTVTVGSDAATWNLTFTASGNWTVEVPAVVSDWCKISPSSGNAGDATVTLSIEPNNGYDERNASLTVRSGTASATFVVRQKQLDAMLVSSSKVELDEGGGRFEIEVKANVDVKYEIPAQYSGWLKSVDNNSRALKSSVYAFETTANDTGANREGVIIFSGSAGTEEVHVYQVGEPTLLLSTATQYVGCAGGRFGVEVASNTSFTYAVAEGGEWLRADESRAMSSHTVYFVADSYDGVDNDRTGKITFVTTDGTVTEDLTVVQRTRGAVIVGDRKIEAGCEGGVYSVAYTANRLMKILAPAWIELTQARPASRSMEGFVQYFEIAPNVSDHVRSGSVVFYDETDAEVRDSVVVSQAALEYEVTTSLRDGDFNDARSHEFTVDVATVMDYEFKTSEEIEPLGDNRFRLKANYEKGKSGTVSVQIRIAGYPVSPVLVGYAMPDVVEPEITEYNVAAAASEFRISIKSNTDICVVSETPAPWLTLKDSDIARSGLSVDTWTFAVAENPTTEERVAEVRFRAGNFWEGTMTVIQSGAVPELPETDVVLGGGTTVEESLGDSMMTVESLSVGGEMTGTDVSAIRAMATDGQLKYLDLSNVSLKKSPAVYMNYMGVKGSIAEDNTIGNLMFFKTKLSHVTLPDNITSVGIRAFGESDVEEVTLPETVESLGYSCFRDCDKLRSVNVPDRVEEIPDRCFEGATALQNVSIGSGVKRIGEFAFAPKEAYTPKGQLYSVSLPDGLEEIGDKAFISTKVAEITIPASVRKMGTAVFSECRNLSRVTFECEMDTLPYRMLYNTLGITELKLPSGLKVIDEYALDHIGMDYLTIPEGVKVLKKGALNGSGKKGLVLPESLEEIGEMALGYQSMVSSFTIPANVKFIGKRAFDGACYITELHIKCAVPPQRDGNIFYSTFRYADCTLYVPRGSAELYSADSYWLKFKAIVEE